MTPVWFTLHVGAHRRTLGGSHPRNAPQSPDAGRSACALSVRPTGTGTVNPPATAADYAAVADGSGVRRIA